MTKQINRPVEVTSYYFAKGRTFKSFPARITLDDQQFSFKSGLQLLVQSGQHAFKLFNMTDGLTNYRLKQENDQWTLLGLESA